MKKIKKHKDTLKKRNIFDHPEKSLITDALHYIGKNMPSATSIQIGAMDGISYDDTRGFFDMYKWNCILVEPIPELFELLKENLKDRINLVYENCAISNYDGLTDMLTVPSDVVDTNNLHPGYKGMSALYPLKNGFGSTYDRDIEVKEKFGINIQVPCMTFDSLMSKYNLDSVDILVCDAEGHDWEIFKQINLSKNNIKFIRLEYINLTEEEKLLLLDRLDEYDYVYQIGNDIDAVHRSVFDKLYTSTPPLTRNNNVTIVSGLWNISRQGRGFEEHYIPRFKEFLQIPVNMVLFLPKELHNIVWEIRDKSNTFVKEYELNDIKNLYSPHWTSTQKIRSSQKWLNMTGENGWLKNSPQAANEWYNPVVQSKMFMMHEACLWNPFASEYFYWLDAGITNTVPADHFINERILDKLPEYSKPFLFLSYPYQANNEIHGFEFNKMNELSNTRVEYVCRGGLFGGYIDQLKDANSTYYALLQDTLNQGYMGTEESIFTIMSYREPEYYKRYMLDENGLIVKFTQAVIDNTVTIEEPVKKIRKPRIITKDELNRVKTHLYMLTFNFPEQIHHTLNSMKKTPEWLNKPKLFLLDNSTDKKAKKENKKIAKEHNFTYIDLKGNRGINGGRQAAAEHFDKSDADFMFFFEDDMTSNPPETNGQFCRNGFRKFVPNLYTIAHKIMMKENFDFLKLSYTEVYMDNNIQVSWYNVPQEVRTKDWPEYDRLPVNGLDPNAPRTEFRTIEVMDGISYITGDIYYANWPMIVSKEGNRKMFIETKWDHPYEQTWMSYMYQKTKEGYIKPAVLLASPIWHDRIKHYKPEERREN